MLSLNFAIAALILSSCSTTPSPEIPDGLVTPVYQEMKKVEWLIGSWRGTSPEGVFGEQWEVTNDSTYSGSGYFVYGKDTVSLETLRLVQEGNKLFYEPTVKKQNDGKAVRFEMTTVMDHSILFENPAHDFPQKISYTLINKDSVVAEISGQQKGKHRSELFPMSRVK